MTSQKIAFEKLNNTRDLFGMQTKDGGRIKPGKLFRSGHLFGASEADCADLADRLSMIIDFRTEVECAEKPNPVIGQTEYLHLPVLRSLTAGITKEDSAVRKAAHDWSQDPKGAMQYMTRMYTQFVTDDYAVAQYARFAKELEKERDGVVLWHCTAGKDRAGFAAVIIQEILGVPREDIFEDYLLTNECLKDEVEHISRRIEKKISEYSGSSVSKEALWLLFSAQKDYLEALYRKVDELYGDFDTFLQKGLNVDPAMREHLREMYLE